MPKSKAEMMRACRAARRVKGLKKAVTVYIRPEDLGRLRKYVETRLNGECPARGAPQTRPQVSGK